MESKNNDDSFDTQLGWNINELIQDISALFLGASLALVIISFFNGAVQLESKQVSDSDSESVSISDGVVTDSDLIYKTYYVYYDGSYLFTYTFKGKSKDFNLDKIKEQIKDIIARENGTLNGFDREKIVISESMLHL